MCFNWKDTLNSLGPVLPICQVGWACSGCKVVIIIMTDSKISLIKDKMELILLASRLVSLELHPLALFLKNKIVFKYLFEQINIFLVSLELLLSITIHYFCFFLWLYLYCHLTQPKSSLPIRVEILYIKGIHFNQFSTFEFLIFIFTIV